MADRSHHGYLEETMNLSFRTLFSLLVVAALVCSLGSIAYAEGDAAAAPDGAALFKKNCAACHGADAKGDTKIGQKMKIRDLTSAEVHATLTREKVMNAIKQGVPKEDDPSKLAMRAFGSKLSDADVGVK
jgi:mono/diheme cytochrome c family protein